jgi:hypothetical protein
VNGLADEYARWKGTVSNLQTQALTLIGDSLLASAFVGYISPFSASFRADLWQNVWTSEIKTQGIPHSEGVDPLFVLASEADIALWKNEGLPADRMSIENAAVVTSCARWPLMIDPQLQGVKWIKQKYGEGLTVIQLTQANWLQKVLMTISMGGILLLESVGQELDAILEPLLSRSVIRRGRSSMVIKIGGEEIDYDPKFQQPHRDFLDFSLILDIDSAHLYGRGLDEASGGAGGVFLGTGNVNAIALERQTGKILWSTPLGSEVLAASAPNKGVVVFRTSNAYSISGFVIRRCLC